jgi:hypothetical protein
LASGFAVRDRRAPSYAWGMPIFRRDRDRPHPILAEGAVRTVARPQPSSPTPEEELPDWVMSSVQVFLEPFFAGNGPLAYGMAFGYGEGH